MSTIGNKNILISPLDWGLGHATRCIPIIKELIKRNCNVIIGADNRPLALLKTEFPDLTFIKLPGYQINYPSNGNMVGKMMLSIPKITKGIKKEHSLLDELIKQYKIDAVISDNRYGLWSDKIPSIFITHQINIKSPIGSSLLKKINEGYISKYDECWIPDYENVDNLSGELSHGCVLPISSQFIGPLSRFSSPAMEGNIEHELGIILSGPEPQRTILEDILLKQLNHLEKSTIVVRGVTDNASTLDSNPMIKITNHLPASQLELAINKSRLIICRPGYSSLMDLSVLGKKAILIPTPGQTEQEYLAELHMQKGNYYSMSQKNINLENAIIESANYHGIEMQHDHTVLKKCIDRLLLRLDS